MTTPTNPDSAPVEPNAPKPHNPDNLTPAQVGEGWRLLDGDEIGDHKRPTESMDDLEGWCSNLWASPPGWRGSNRNTTYRTKLTRAELRAARGLSADAPTSNPEGESATRLEEGAVYRDDTDGGLFVCASDKPDSQRDVPCVNFDGSCGFVHYALGWGIEKVANSISEYFALKLTSPVPPSPISDEARKAAETLRPEYSDEWWEKCAKKQDRYLSVYMAASSARDQIERVTQKAIDSALANLKAVAEAWSPIHYEIDRRADKMHAEAENTDFEVTINIEDYRRTVEAMKGDK